MVEYDIDHLLYDLDLYKVIHLQSHSFRLLPFFELLGAIPYAKMTRPFIDNGSSKSKPQADISKTPEFTSFGCERTVEEN